MIDVQALAAAVEQNTVLMRELLQELRKQSSEWVDADEAARLIGINVVRSNKHRQRLSAAARRGIIQNFIPGKPYRYDRKECVEIARKRASGEVFI